MIFALDNAFFATKVPGCYNDADFRAVETRDPRGALQSYARFVLQRDQAEEERARVRRIVAFVIQQLSERTDPKEIQRNCFAASMACLSMLEAAGVWAFVLTGSTRFHFPANSGISDQFFWSTDEAKPGHKAGHAWLVAPPFQLIDVTLAAQGWSGPERGLLPRYVAVETVTQRPSSIELLVPPEHRRGIQIPSEVKQFWRTFSPCEVRANEVEVTYQPVGVTVPAETFSDATLILGGRRALKFFEDEVQPGLAEIARTA